MQRFLDVHKKNRTRVSSEETISSLHTPKLNALMMYNRVAHRVGQSHEHVSDTSALGEMLEKAEEILPFRTIEYGSYLFEEHPRDPWSSKSELRMILKKLPKGQRFNP